MQMPNGVICCCAVLTMALAGSAARAQGPSHVDDQALKNAPKDGDAWLTTGRDYAETRYSPLDQINTSTVGRLGLAWFYDTDSEAGPLEATPTVSDGVMYATGTWSTVFAVDARTGKEKWRFDPKIGHQNFPPGPDGQPDSTKPRTGPSICCGPVNRGVALYDGKVYAGLLDGRLIAFNAQTGKIVWQVQTTDPNADYSITGAPRIVKGKVIIGNGGAEFGVRGYVTAYDAETGKQMWRFYIVPGDPSKPQENKALYPALKTWTGDTWYKIGGGGTAWDAFAYDPELDLLYVGTGNGGPYPLQWRSPGPGNNDNLYLSSIVALRPDTGEYVWHFQETPGDEWDYTAVQDMILANLKIDGTERKVIMQAPKSGFFYVLDRETGKFLSAMPIASVSWATGIDQKTGRPIIAPGARYDETGSWVSPSGGGVHSVHSMSFNPATGLAYIPGGTSNEWFAVDPNFHYKLGVFNWGQLRNAPVYGVRAKVQPGPKAPSQGPTMAGGGADATPLPVFGSFLVAWDPVTQKERWRVPQMNGGGTVTTAGNLVFACSSDGRLVAFSADKGEKLWEVKLLPGLSNPSTFMLDGKQYVSVLAGTAGHGKLYTFVLDGHAAMPTIGAPLPGGKTTQDGVYSEAQAARGKAQYMQQCAACHGADLAGQGGQTPALTGAAFVPAWNGHSADDLYELIRTSMPKGNPNSLAPDAYADILAYIFQSNNFPAGTGELESTPNALKSVTISTTKSAPTR
jgi:quinohemoprotein ethanol dehydrogenase